MRRDEVEGHWVVIAPERSRRPGYKLTAPRFALPAVEGQCPFCQGHEAETPPEVASFGRTGSRPDEPGWLIRIVPNKYAALVEQGATAPAGETVIPARGAHEVVIMGPDHVTSLHELSDDILALGLRAVAERMLELNRRPEVATVQAFFNIGREAGATLPHAHGQLMALPVVPDRIMREAERFASSAGCPLCRQMVGAGRQCVVLEREGMVVYCPPAASAPYEWCLAPRDHLPSFCDCPEDYMNLAIVLKAALAAQAAHLDDPPYNMYLHSSPAMEDDDFHWHFRCRPRLTIDAGFELATGLFINPMEPAESAAALRDCLPGSWE